MAIRACPFAQLLPERRGRACKICLRELNLRHSQQCLRLSRMHLQRAGGELLGEVGEGNRKDIRNAVEAAHKAEGWGRTTAHNRAQVLYYLAENLSARVLGRPEGFVSVHARIIPAERGTSAVVAILDERREGR